MWGFTLIWCAVSAPLLWQIIERWGKPDETWGLLLGLLFPTTGVILIGVSAFATWSLLRFGPAPLWPDPSPGSIGGQVGGHIDIHYGFAANQLFNVQLSCLYSRVSGSSKNRSRSESVVWQTDGVCAAEPISGGVRLRFTFDVPPGLPATDPVKSGAYHLWRASISADLEGPDFRRSYELPVTAGSARHAAQPAATSDNPHTFEAALAGIEAVAEVRPSGDGIEAYFGAFKRPAAGFITTLFGLVFAGIGAVTLSGTGPFLLGVIFLLLGGGIACSGVFALGKSLLVSVTPWGLRTRRFLFGYPLRTRKLPVARFAALEIEQAGSMQSGNRRTVFYTLRARGRGDIELTVAERLESRAEAEFLRDNFLTYLGRES